jgi:3-dehydroquinate synthase
VKVNLGDRSYDIVIGDGALQRVGELSSPLVRGRSAAIISNDVVGPLYAEALEESLERAGFRSVVLTVPDGEEQKTLGNVGRLCEELVRAKLDRSACVFALGGGVVGDLAGFVASVYLRGVDFIQVPTSLLAQVDSSVGGKTGVNLPQAKNMVGAFHQPKLVVIDPVTLKTLPDRELGSGLAEIIKHGIIGSLSLFEYLEENIERILALDTGIMASVIEESCTIKAGVVAADEREANLRAILNCGHTLGHAVETAGGYGRYRHGEAVAIGLVAEAVLAEIMGVAEAGLAQRIAKLLKRARLPIKAAAEISTEAVLEIITVDKKVMDGKVRFVLPHAIGKVSIVDCVDREHIAEAFELCRED